MFTKQDYLNTLNSWLKGRSVSDFLTREYKKKYWISGPELCGYYYIWDKKGMTVAGGKTQEEALLNFLFPYVK